MMKGRMIRGGSGARRTLVLLVMCTGLLMTPASAKAGGTQGLLVQPLPGSHTSPQGDYFVMTGRPGESVKQFVIVQNTSDETMRVRIDGVDAHTAPYGGVAYGMPEDAVTATGSWIDLKRSQLRLRPGVARKIAFIVTVPEQARPGVHVAGLSVTPIAKVSSKEGSETVGASVQFRTRSVVAVQVEAPGEAKPDLVVTGVHPIARPDGLYLEVEIANEGTGFAKGEGVIELPDGKTTRFTLDTFVPGTKIAYPIRWTDGADNGDYPVRVALDYTDDASNFSSSIAFEGEFQMDEEIQIDLADRSTDTSPSTTPPVPYFGYLGVALAACIAGTGATLVLGKRRRVTAAPQG